LVEGDFLTIMIDADRNAGTGCDGAESALSVLGHTYNAPFARFARCAGGNWNYGTGQGAFSFSEAPGSGVEGPGAVSFGISTADIGTANFGFQVGSSYEGIYDDYYDTTAKFSFASAAPQPTPPPVAPKPPVGPAITIARHANSRAEATGPTGAKVTYRLARVTGAKFVSYSKRSGSVFRLGKTIVTITARNGTRIARSTFAVFVVDTKMPTFTTLRDISTNATVASGATVTYGPLVATDRVDQNVAVACSAPSGSVFAAGTTSVFCTARDDAGNTASATFKVTVPVFVDPMSVQTITSFQSDAAGLLIGATTAITTSAAVDPLTYTWVASNGSISSNGISATWIRAIESGQPAPGTLTVTVSHTAGGPDSTFTITFT
jgi:hypothetical protein